MKFFVSLKVIMSYEELDSSYFSTGPAHSDSQDSVNNYYEKGAYSSSTDSHNLISSQGGNKISVDFNRIRVMLESLVPYCDTQVTDLSGEAKSNLDYILKISKAISKTPLYSKLYDNIKKIFKSHCSTPIPGSVGAFFIGCAVSSCGFKGPNECDPRCAGSLTPPSGSKNCKKCQQVCVLYDEHGHIRPLNNVNAKDSDGTGYIVVLGKDFDGFSKRDISTFERRGLKKASYLRWYDGKYHHQSEMVEVSQLPIKTKSGGKCDNGSSSISGGAVAIIVVAIVVIILVLFFFFFRGNATSDYVDGMGRNGGYSGRMRV